jgi:hypothetical protein
LRKEYGTDLVSILVYTLQSVAIYRDLSTS